ncbi:MAG: Uma2 family endonuclease [Pyrinomonadaceae bacterium]|nr:Uma2 family endonuclease [Pyrinomonadaceae bacterium]
MTADELLALPHGQFCYELINGELKKMSPAGHDRGRLAMELAGPLQQFVKKKKLGKIYAAETGFLLTTNPDTVRAPDIAFIAQERVDKVGRSKGYWIGPPDLAVEVMSPSDTVSAVEDKLQMWLKSGTQLVWVVSPKLLTITVYRSGNEIQILTEKDTLDAGNVIPGFQILVAEIFGE